MTNGSAQRLPGPFGPVKDLLPKEQVIERVRHDESVASALERMADNDYSQLPVERDGEVVGLFSWRSFGCVVGRPPVATNGPVEIPEIAVSQCIVQARFIGPEAFIDTGIDWTDQDCVLVGSPTELIGLLAIYDVVGRLQDFGEAFFLIHETEHLLRDMLTEAVGATRLAEMLATMTLPPNCSRPQALEDMNFSMYGDLACSRSRWAEFKEMFFGDRAAMKGSIDAIAKVRNVVFHFKRPVTVEDVDTLRRFRDRLLQQRERFHHSRASQSGQGCASGGVPSVSEPLGGPPAVNQRTASKNRAGDVETGL